MSDDGAQANPARAAAVEVHEADDGYVIYDETRQRVHYLNATAALVFELCDGQRDEPAIARLLGAAAGGDRSGDVADAVAMLRREGLVAP